MRLFCLVLAVLCLGISIPSCKHKTDYSFEIARLDSVLFGIDRGMNDHLHHDFDKEMHDHLTLTFGNLLDSISNKIKSDTVPPSLAILLSNCYEDLQNLRNFQEKREYYFKEFNDQETRVANLKHDLENDLIEQNKAKEYVVKEIEEFQKKENSAWILQLQQGRSSFKLDSLKEKLITIKDSLYSE